MRICILLLACLTVLLTVVIKTSTAKSYSLQSLSSSIYIRNKECTLKVTEQFRYEFNGIYSRIGRPLPPITSNAYDRSVVLLSDNGYKIKTEYEKINNSPYIVMYLDPPTPETGTTVISFILSYTISGNSLFESSTPSSSYVSYYYLDNNEIPIVNSTFIFDSTIDFSDKPRPQDGGILSQNSNQEYSIFYSKTNVKNRFIPGIYFNTISNQYEKCKYDQNAINAAIIISSLVGCFLIIGIVFFFLFRKKGSGCCGCGGGGGGGDGSGDGSGGGNYTSFNDNNFTTSNDFGGGGGGGSSSHGGSGFAD